MLRLAMDAVRPEMLAAVDVMDPGGRFLIRAGRPFQENHIEMMQNLGFGSAYVNLPYFSQTPPQGDIVRPELRRALS